MVEFEEQNPVHTTVSTSPGGTVRRSTKIHIGSDQAMAGLKRALEELGFKNDDTGCDKEEEDREEVPIYPPSKVGIFCSQPPEEEEAEAQISSTIKV